ncbi:MAG TPA: hypothetical protein PL040_02425, partial [Bacteroidales bacterium]|nr:hypothetical protein [Bacteroidales bacterium]
KEFPSEADPFRGLVRTVPVISTIINTSSFFKPGRKIGKMQKNNFFIVNRLIIKLLLFKISDYLPGSVSKLKVSSVS